MRNRIEEKEELFFCFWVIPNFQLFGSFLQFSSFVIGVERRVNAWLIWKGRGGTTGINLGMKIKVKKCYW